jgi:hypothetical protein
MHNLATDIIYKLEAGNPKEFNEYPLEFQVCPRNRC